MLGLLVAITLLVVIWLLQAPAWLKTTAMLALSAGLMAALLAISSPERALAPLLLFAVALALLLPGAAPVRRKARIAPRKKRERKGSRTRRTLDTEGIDVPGYEVLEKVGSGGMATVYRARKRSGGRIVALKIPMEQYVADAMFIRRFHREAEVAQRLDHPNIVRTFEHGSRGVRHYMAMEYVEGRSLESYIETGELSPRLTVEIMKRVVDALQHIHSAGIVHRDIKPANIMVLAGGVSGGEELKLDPDAVKLMDFGIAGGNVLTRLTATGARIGTPVYMSPEQARGQRIDHRSDIYSLGLVLYEMLTGQTAFKGGYDAVVHQQIFQDPPPPRQLDLTVPRALDELVMRMVAKEPAMRPSLEEIATVLEGPDSLAHDLGELGERIIVSVSSGQGVLRILDGSGALHTSLGDIGPDEDSFPAAPTALTVDADGNIYAAVVQYGVGAEARQMVRKLSPRGELLTSFGRYGSGDGELLYPASLAAAGEGGVYVLDVEAHRVQRFDANGQFLFGFGERGTGKGQFEEPRMIAADAQGRLYVLDYGNRRVQRFDAAGNYERLWAFRSAGEGSPLRLLEGITVSPRGDLYLVDGQAGKVRRIAGDGKLVGSVAVDDASDDLPSDVLVDLGVDDSGNLFVARRGGRYIQKFDEDGRLVATLDAYLPIVHMRVDVRPSQGRQDTLIDQGAASG